MRKIRIEKTQDGIEIFSDGLEMFAAPFDLSGGLLVDLHQLVEFLEDVTGNDVEIEGEEEG